MALPLLSPELNSIHRSATFHLAEDGWLEGKVTERRYGDSASMRRCVQLRGRTSEGAVLNQVLRQDFASFAVTDFKQDNHHTIRSGTATLWADDGAAADGADEGVGQQDLRPNSACDGPADRPDQLMGRRRRR